MYISRTKKVEFPQSDKQSNQEHQPVPILPAATVLVIREAHDQLEVLLLKRNKSLAFAPNVWVFPGGRLDPDDRHHEQEDTLLVAKRAAVRECKEEANLDISTSSLHHFCKWTTPIGGNKRFETFFFHAYLSDVNKEVIIDDSEIVDHMWVTPHEGLSLFTKQNINLLPPTFITLERIKDCRSYQDVVSEFNRTGVVEAKPVTTFVEGKFYSLYEGDSGYAKVDITETQVLHRLVMDMSKSTYQFLHSCPHHPPVNGGVNFISKGMNE